MRKDSPRSQPDLQQDGFGSKASNTVRQGSSTHGIRAGKGCTPPRASNSPWQTLLALMSAFVAIASTALLNSRTLCQSKPRTTSVNRDAEARHSAQPKDSNDASRTMPSSTRRYTVMQSPQSGFLLEARKFALERRPQLRGRFAWSRITGEYNLAISYVIVFPRSVCNCGPVAPPEVLPNRYPIHLGFASLLLPFCIINPVIAHGCCCCRECG